MIGLIKLNSKRALDSSWGTALAQTLILWSVTVFFIMTGIISYGLLCLNVSDFFIFDILSSGSFIFDISFDMPSFGGLCAMGFIFIAAFLVISPFKFGSKAWYYSLSDGKKKEELALCFFPFASFKLFFKVTFLNIILAVKKAFIYFVFCCIPTAILGFSIWYKIEAQTLREEFLASACLICGLALFIAALAFSFIYCLRWFALPYAFLQNNCKGIRTAFKNSVQASKGYKGSILLFFVSMIFYHIGNFIPVISLYTNPVTQEAHAIYSRFLLEDLKRRKEYENKIKEDAENPKRGYSPCEPSQNVNREEEKSYRSADKEEQTYENSENENAPQDSSSDSARTEVNEEI